jgi:ACS family tartrate transporter-like MFS transporter
MSASPAPARPIERATIRRVTIRILPFLMLCYFVAYLDSVNVGFAALQMNQDLHFSSTVFGLGAGIFFVSYCFCEVPSNLALERVGARRWIARIMISWGVIAAAMPLVTGPWSFYLLRFLLGAAEAGFFPGVILYLAYWYPAEHRARIIALFTVAIPVSQFLGSPISAALLGTDGWLSLRGWQWMYLAEAVPAVLLGFACLLVLSDGPAQARWLTEEQRGWLADRLLAERIGAAPASRLSVWKVMYDRRVLVLSLVLGGSTANSRALQLWQPQIIKAFGLTNMETGLLNAVGFAVAAPLMIFWGRLSDRLDERSWHTALPLALVAFGLAGTLVTNALVTTVAFLCLAVIGIYAAKGPAWALATERLSADEAAAGLAQINAISNLAGFGTVYLIGLIKDHTGSYPLALLPSVALAVAACLSIPLIGGAATPAAAAVRSSGPELLQR